jgi:hypothetical protein
MTLTVVWSRSDGMILSCSGLSIMKFLRRLRGAIRNSGPVTIYEARIE